MTVLRIVPNIASDRVADVRDFYAGLFGLDELLTSVTMGVIVGNYHLVQEKIIGMIERYIEELIFVLFFTLRGMYLNFSIFPAMLPFVVLYVLLRTLGKYLGAVIGAGMARSL